MKIDLIAKDEAQKRILEYLENNASETLASKINNGVQVEKDSKQLLSKKDLDSFFVYAQEEARKLLEKGRNCACVEDKTVYGWAIHYFEEDSIEGKLFNLDGTEYGTVKPVIQVKKETPKVEVKPKPQQQSLFDLITTPKVEETDDEDIEEDIEEENLSYKAQCAKYSQVDTLDSYEEIEDIPPMIEIDGQKEEITIENQTFDKYILKTISNVFDGKIKLK